MKKNLFIGLHDAEMDHFKSKSFPNYALMKIAAWHKAPGDEVEWWNPLKRYDRVYSSKIFDFTPMDPYLPEDVIKGGTGYRDIPINKELPKEIDTSNRYGLVMAFLSKFYKSGCGQALTGPLHTITTSPGHFGAVSVLAAGWEDLMKAGIEEEAAQKCTWVSRFIMEYYGCGVEQGVDDPLHTIVTKDRFALITVLGNKYVILDIFLRMLKPEELKLGQGFPADYIIDRDINYRPYSKKEQVARIGNSVVPVMARKLVEANCKYLKEGNRPPSLRLDTSGEQIKFV